MAPLTLDQTDEQLKAIVQNLYNLIVQTVEHQGDVSQQAMKREIQTLIQHLVELMRTAQHTPIEIPSDIIAYVETSKNPDVYTRQFVEAVQDNNQRLKGKAEAFGLFRDILAKEIMTAIPDLQSDVKRVVESTGGKVAAQEEREHEDCHQVGGGQLARKKTNGKLGSTKTGRVKKRKRSQPLRL